MCTAVKKRIYKILAAKNTTEIETRPVPEFFAGLISTTSSVVFFSCEDLLYSSFLSLKHYFCPHLLVTCHQIVEIKFTWTRKALRDNGVLRTVSS